jgi:hypothetical protein
MAVSAFGTAGALFLFTVLTSAVGQVVAGCVASLLQNAVYGVLYSEYYFFVIFLYKP